MPAMKRSGLSGPGTSGRNPFLVDETTPCGPAQGGFVHVPDFCDSGAAGAGPQQKRRTTGYCRTHLKHSAGIALPAHSIRIVKCQGSISFSRLSFCSISSLFAFGLMQADSRKPATVSVCRDRQARR